MKNSIKNLTNGFTLIECVIAMVVALVGLLAIYTLILMAVQTQTVSRDLEIANSFARAKVEELENSTRTAGGDLNANAVGYFDNPSAQYVRRWQVSDDTMGTQTVSVRLVPNRPDMRLPESLLVTRMK